MVLAGEHESTYTNFGSFVGRITVLVFFGPYNVWQGRYVGGCLKSIIGFVQFARSRSIGISIVYPSSVSSVASSVNFM